MSNELARRGSTVATAMTAHVDAIEGLLGLLDRLHEVGVIPDKMTMAQATMACMAGARFGMDPITSMNSFYIVNGRATMAASAMQAVCLAHPDCEYFMLVESNAEGATYEAKRKSTPQAVRISYTADDAKIAGLWGKGTWRAHPAQMLVARASSRLARAVFPDALHGMYTREELTNGEDIDDADIIEATYTPAPQREPSRPPQQQPEPDVNTLMGFIEAHNLTSAVELYMAAKSAKGAECGLTVDAYKALPKVAADSALGIMREVYGGGDISALWAGAQVSLTAALGRECTKADTDALAKRIAEVNANGAGRRAQVIAAALMADHCVRNVSAIHLRLGLPKVEAVEAEGGEA